MVQQFTSPRIEQWQQEFEQNGRLEINSSLKSLSWRVGLAVAIVALVIWSRYNAGDIGTRGLTIAIVGFVVLIAGLVAFVVWRYGNKKLVAERDGLTTMDGTFYPWNDITDVTVWTDPRARSASSVQLNLTESAWNAHLAKQHVGGSMMHKANKMIARNRAIVLPSFLDAPVEHMSAFLNQYAAGREEQ